MAEIETRLKIEIIGMGLFVLFYTMVLLNSIFLGVEEFSKVSFYATVFLLCVVVLWAMIDKLDLPVFRIDTEVIVASVLGGLIIFCMFAVPYIGTWVVAQMGVLLAPVPLHRLLTTLLFVSVSESMVKYIWVEGMERVKVPWWGCVLIAAGGFALLHVFRYGFFSAPFFYVFFMGILLLMLGRMPKVLGSAQKWSLIPLIVTHTIHNMMVPAGSVLLV